MDGFENKEIYESLFPGTQVITGYLLKELIFYMTLPTKLSLPKMMFSIKIKYYLYHSTRYRNIGHTRQLRVQCRKPRTRTRRPHDNKPRKVGSLTTSKALTLTLKGLQ